MALTTDWREGREGKSCNSSLRTKSQVAELGMEFRDF